MNIPTRYLRLPHATDCTCGVCASAAAHAKAQPAAKCPDCKPPKLYQLGTRWYCDPAQPCPRHSPRKAPRYWFTIHTSANPTPYIPLHTGEEG